MNLDTGTQPLPSRRQHTFKHIFTLLEASMKLLLHQRLSALSRRIIPASCIAIVVTQRTMAFDRILGQKAQLQS